MNQQNVSALQQLGTIGLQPAARPVDQYARPEVRYDDNANGLLQLAQALSSINPEIKDTLSRLGQTTERNMRQQAKVDAAALSLKNKQDFQNAVDQGLIKEQDNPWYHAQMDQEIAGAEARAYTQKLQVDYTQNGLMYSKNPQQLDQWVQDATAQMLQGRNGAEAEAIIGEMEPFRQKLVQGHIQFQAQMTDRERRASILTGLSGILRKYSTEDFNNPQVQPQIQKEIGDFRAERALTFNEDELDDLVYQSLEAESESRTANVARPTLSGIVRRDGTSLADQQLNHAKLDALDVTVGRLALQRGEQEEALYKQNQERATRDTVAKAQTAAQAQGIPFSQYHFSPTDFAKLDPEIQRSFLALQVQIQSAQEAQQNATQQDKRKDADRQLYSLDLHDLLDPAKEKDLLGILAVNGGDADIRQWMEFKQFQKRNQWGTASPDTATAIVEKWTDGTLTLADLSSLAKAHEIDAESFHYWTNRVLESGGSWGSPGRAPDGLSAYISLIPELVATKSADAYVGRSLDQIQNDPAVASRITLARMNFIDAVNALQNDPSFRSLTDIHARQQRIEQAFTTVLSDPSVNAFTKAEYRDHLAKQAEQRKEAQQAELAAAEAAKAVAEAKYAKEHPQDSKFLPPNAFSSPLVPSLSDDQKATLRRAVGAGSSFSTPDGRTVYGISDYDPQYLFTKSNPLMKPVQDLYAAWQSQLGPTYSVAYQMNAGKELPALQKITANRKALEAQMERQGAKAKFESVMAALQTRDQRSKSGGQWFVTPQEKRTIYEFVDNARTLSVLRSMSTYDLDEVTKMGKGSEMNVPMFYGTADLNSAKLQEIAKAVGRTSLEQQAEFHAAQAGLLAQRRRQLLNLR